MKKSMSVVAVIVLMSLTPEGKDYFQSGNTMASDSGNIILAHPASSTPFSCTCSCGKNCGVCSFAFENCTVGAAIACVTNCCKNAPNECDRGPILPSPIL